MEDLKYEEIPELKKKLNNIGVATETLNRLPAFEASMKPRQTTRTFEGKYGKVTVEGRLGQVHKTLLETILFKKELHDYIHTNQVIGGGKIKVKYLKVLYDREKIRKYMAQGKGKYSKERYKILLDDMMRTILTLNIKGEEVRGPLVIDLYDSPTFKPINTKSPIIPKEVKLTTIIFGSVITTLIENELKFTYSPKLIMALSSGVSQALVRFLLTHQNHPAAGYHLKQLVKNLDCPTEGGEWYDIKRALKRDAEQLEILGVVINFEKERLFVVKNILENLL